jgi:hypothetical protein
MWADYNTLSFPIVEVKLRGNIQNDEDFKKFLEDWLKIYEKKKDFVFLFDTTDVGFVNIKYAFKMASFVKELKKRDIQYLKHSIIITNSWWVKFLLKIIFSLQSPVCTIEYHSDFNNIDLENLIVKTREDSTLELQ